MEFFKILDKLPEERMRLKAMRADAKELCRDLSLALETMRDLNEEMKTLKYEEKE